MTKLGGLYTIVFECRRTIEKLHEAFASQAVPRSMAASSSSSSEVNAAPFTGSEVQCSLPVQAKLLFKRSWCAPSRLVLQTQSATVLLCQVEPHPPVFHDMRGIKSHQPGFPQIAVWAETGMLT